MSDKLVLGYWGVRGRGQILRHLLSYTGLQFEQESYFLPQQYGKVIPQLGPFPNLPYLKDGDFTVTQTLGIARYIARRAGKPQLLGKTPKQQAIMQNFMYAFEDLQGPVMALFFNPKVKQAKIGHLFKIRNTLEKFNKFLNGKQWILGYVTIADFFLAQYSHYFEKLFGDQFRIFKNMMNLRNNLENLPQVKKYYQRKNAILTPFLPPNRTTIPFFWPGTEPKNLQIPVYKQKSSQTEAPKKPAVSKPAQQPKVEPKPDPKPQPKPEPVPEPEPEQTFENDVEAHIPQTPHKVVVMSGSLSGNNPINHFLGLVTGLGHPAINFQWCDISNLEIYNEDTDQSGGTQNVNNLRGQIYEAEGILIGVTEAHGMISPLLSNAFNWLVPVLKEKPVALTSVQCSEAQFRKALESQQIPFVKSAKLSIADYGSYLNENGQLAGPSLNRVINFINKFSIFLQTGN